MNRGTWWFDSGGLVGWNFKPMSRSDGRLVPLDLGEEETRRRWLGDLIGRLPVLLGDFGFLTRVIAYARGKGEFVIDWRHEGGPAALLAFLEEGRSLGLEADIDLTCLDSNLEPMEVPNGAEFLVNIRFTDSGDLDPKTDAPVYLRLGLNADIYAPWSLGDIQDNKLLAALNGPRLSGFLERIERDVPAELLEIHQDHHPRGAVGPRGFIAPPGSLQD